MKRLITHDYINSSAFDCECTILSFRLPILKTNNLQLRLIQKSSCQAGHSGSEIGQRPTAATVQPEPPQRGQSGVFGADSQPTKKRKDNHLLSPSVEILLLYHRCGIVCWFWYNNCSISFIRRISCSRCYTHLSEI